jgi:hypothetical protein
MKDSVLKEEIKRFRELMNYDSNKSNGLISESKERRFNNNFLFYNENEENKKILEMHNKAKFYENQLFKKEIDYRIYDLAECIYDYKPNYYLLEQEENEVDDDDLYGVVEPEDNLPEEEEIELFKQFLQTYVSGFEDDGVDYSDVKLPKIGDVISLNEQNYFNVNSGDAPRWVKNIGKWWERYIGKPIIKGAEKFWDAIKGIFKKIFNGNDKEFIKDLLKKYKKYKRKVRRKVKNALRKTKKQIKKIKRKLRRKPLVKKWIDTKNFKFGISKWINLWSRQAEREEMDSETEYETDTPQEEWLDYLENNDKTMVSKMTGSVSKQNWQDLKSDTGNTDFAVAVLENFNRTYPDKKWTKVIIGQDTEEIEKIKEKEKGEPEYLELPFDFPLLDSPGQLFKDNCWDLSNAPVLKKNVDVFIDQLKIAIESIKNKPEEDQPVGYLKEMWLRSSCSRYRNTTGKVCDAADLTFAQLGENRLNTAKDYVLQKLKELNIGYDDKTIFNLDWLAKKSDINPDGNGDGSSGPNPPTGTYITIDGRYDNLAKESERNKYGTPLGSKTDYEKFKFVDGTFVIVLNDKKDDDDDPKDDPDIEIIEEVTYPVIFYRPPRHLRIPLLGVRFKMPKFKFNKYPTYGPPNKKPGATKCEFFN